MGRQPKSKWSWQQVGPIATTILTLITLASSIVLWRTTIENRRLENELAEVRIQRERSGLSLDRASTKQGLSSTGLQDLQHAQLQPQFSVQYLFLRGSVYQDALDDRRLNLPRVRRTRAAEDAVQRLWAYAMIDRGLAAPLHDEAKVSAFIRSQDHPGYVINDSDFMMIDHLVLVVSAFGGTLARDVELVYEERAMRPPFALSSELGNLLSAQPDDLARIGPLSRRVVRLRLGDIAPGDGRIIEVQASMPFDQNRSAGDNPSIGPDQVIAPRYIYPLFIRYRTLSGQIMTLNVRKPFDFPIPVAATIEGMG